VNPYTLLLAQSILGAGAELRYFDWRTALTARFDVFHVHWPEILVDGRTPARQLVRQVLTLLVIARLALLRRPIVRTVHNLDLPEGLSLAQRSILALIDRRTAYRVRLNDHTPMPDDRFATIPHGDFRGWFEGYERLAPIEGRVGYVGRIRRYKGVEALLDAFADTARVGAGAPTTGLSARIVGYASTPELAENLGTQAASDPRVSIEFGFVSDAEIVDVVTSSSLVVLPYRSMHNSSAAITGLSLDRPVLVPDNAVTRDLAAEMGPGWVHVFEGELSAGAILDALAAPTPDSPPDMRGRDWSDSGRAHVAAFAAALGRRA
jgi:glycosyltransferase involved in cell wall biosynthesis